MQLENGGSPQRIPEILWEDGEVRNDEEVEKLLEEIKKGQGQNFLPAMEQQIKFALKYRMSKEGIEALCQRSNSSGQSMSYSGQKPAIP